MSLKETETSDYARVQALEQENQRLRAQVAELGDVRKAAVNLLEDLDAEQQKLAEAKAKDDAMLESIGDGVVVVDETAKIIFINKAAIDLLRLTSDALLGQELDLLFNVDDPQKKLVSLNERPLISVIKTGQKITSNDYYFMRPDHSLFPVSFTAAPMILEGKIVGVVGVFRDISKEKEIDKAKTEFVSLASHQLRTPLSAVRWFTGMLSAGDAGALNEKQKEYVDEVYNGNKRMIELVNALLNVSRLELGTFIVEPKPTNVVELIQGVINEQRSLIEKKLIQFSTAFEDGLPLVNIDVSLLRMVVQNMLINAIKYTPVEGQVDVSVSLDTQDHSLLIKIADTGYGIPKDQQDSIFTKLFRADNVREKDTEGSGLGLYIVKSILDQAGGKVWFESVEDKGSTFYVSLPASGMKKKAGTKALA